MSSYPVGHQHHPTAPEVWADVVGVACTNCGASVGDYCRLEVNDRTYSRHLPCLSRIKAAERQAS